MAFNRDQFLDLRKKGKVQKVSVQDLGEVYVRELSVGEITELQQGEQVDAGKLLVLSVCDENGKRICSDADAGIAAQIPQNIAIEIIDAIAKLNKMEKDSVKVAEKNSEVTPTASSVTDSPGT